MIIMLLQFHYTNTQALIDSSNLNTYKRILTGARSRTMELLPPLGTHTSWILPLVRSNSISSNSNGPMASSVAAGSGANPLQGDEQQLSPSSEQTSGADRAAIEEEEGGNLGAYSAGSVYSKRAVQFQLDEMANFQHHQLMMANDPAVMAATNGQSKPTVPTRRAGSRINPKQRRPRGQRKQQYRNQKAESRRLAARSTSATKLRNVYGRNLQLPVTNPARLVDSGNIYHDQVYRFDGHSSAVQVPRTVFAGELSRLKGNQSTGQHLFGSKHTISFWMRHSPFRFISNGPGQQGTAANASSTTGNEPPQSQRELDELSRHVKEHLLCATLELNPAPAATNPEADYQLPSSAEIPLASHSNNKHHYSILIRNCRLVLLMRRRLDYRSSQQQHQQQQQQDNNSKTYLPAEWRWSLPANEACDNKWHLYTINVNFPTVELYVDGSQFEESYDNLVVVDDLLLRPIEMSGQQRADSAQSISGVTYEDDPQSIGPDSSSSSSSSAQLEGLSIGLGACWDGHQRTWYGHFRGSLSGLNVLVNNNDDSRSIECLGGCSEELVSTAQWGTSAWPMHDQEQQPVMVTKPTSVPMVDDGPAIKMDNSLISYQESQSKILLQGHDFLDVEEALTQIAYVNHRQLPSIGKRQILIDTSVECQSPIHPTSSSTINNNDQQQQQQQQQSTSTTNTIPFNIPIEPIRVEINVLPSKNLPVLTIGGTPNLAREYGALIEGVRLFSSINLRSKRLNLEQFMRHAHPNIANPKTAFVQTSREQQQTLKTFLTSSSSSSSSNNNSNQSSNRHQTNVFQPSPEDADYIEDSIADISGSSDNEEPQQQQQQQRQNEQRTNQPINLSSTRRRVEACSVQVYPPLNGLHESLVLPWEQLDQLQLYWRQSYEGLMVYGLDSIDNYEKILRSILYKNQKPAYYLERVFRLLCSDLNGRLLSNEYLQTVTIIHQSKRSEQTATMNETKPKNINSNLNDVDNGDEQIAPPNKPALLIRQPMEKFDLQGPKMEPIATTSWNSFVGQNGQSMPLNLEQSTQLDRVALAFLVFVVSLIVIMLVITLTNLKEPNIGKDDESYLSSLPCDTIRNKRRKANNRWSKNNKHLVNGDREDCNYVDEQASDLDEEMEQENDDEQEEEDFYEDDTELPVSCDNDDHFNNVHAKCAKQMSKPKRKFNQRIQQQSRYEHSNLKHNLISTLYSSQTTTDQESLAWDEEELGGEEEEEDEENESEVDIGDEQTTIVMNPILHGDEKQTASTSSNHQHGFKMLITEQRPNWRGAITQKPKSHLSYWSAASIDDYEFEEEDEDDEDEQPQGIHFQAEQQLRPNNKRQQQHYSHTQEDDEEELSSCCSSASGTISQSSGSSSSSGTSDSESDSNEMPEVIEGRQSELIGARRRCGHFQRHHYIHHHHHHHLHHNQQRAIDEEEEPEEEVLWSGGAGGYELYHRHHLHHRCLKQEQQQQASNDEETDDNEDDAINVRGNGSQMEMPTTTLASNEIEEIDLSEMELRTRTRRRSLDDNEQTQQLTPTNCPSASTSIPSDNNSTKYYWPSQSLTAALTCASSSQLSPTESCGQLSVFGSSGSGIDSLNGSTIKDEDHFNETTLHRRYNRRSS